MEHQKYEAVIGLEVHAQLKTASKLFCGDSTAFGAEPNTQVSPISLAHPGTLPRMNEKAIEYAVRLGLALNCEIVTHNYFARKNYFYPDLPKGYQVSQHTAPICKGGTLSIDLDKKKRDVQLNRIHLEEDAGKSIHDLDPEFTCIDLNRAGIPLVEIVTEPCIHSAEEAFAYLTELRKIVRWVDVCDGNMEEGSLRCDANVSIRTKGETNLGTKVEIKNLNSIRNVRRAIECELQRLISLAENNEPIIQETRGYNEHTHTTFAMRTKEAADDYRYFPEPDLTPFLITEEYINNVKADMPVMPAVMQQQMMQRYGLNEYDAVHLCTDRDFIYYFQQISEHNSHYKAIANWMLGPVRNYLNESGDEIGSFPLLPSTMAELINLVDENKISFGNASGKLMHALIQNPSAPVWQTAIQLNLAQESDNNAIAQWVEEAIQKMPDKVKEYQSGKKGLIGLFAGEVKKLSKGKADMKQVTTLLENRLNQKS